MVFVINKHQNDQWLQYHSLSCIRLLNIGLNTEVYLHDSRLSNILSCDESFRINVL